ncbi:MAG: ribosomal-processing cysteine protease Prp [Treponema sp.]|nr:ribosomal-processing cysteine protease Prp [Treponema sp.]
MLRIKADLDRAGLLRACRVEGHAGAGLKGTDIVCAAVSVLVRTALRTLSGRKGITVRGCAPERGLLWMETDYTEEGRGFLAAAGAFLIEGLMSVSEDFPDYCRIDIHRDPAA